MADVVRLDPFQRLLEVHWRAARAGIAIIGIAGFRSGTITAETIVTPPGVPAMLMPVTIGVTSRELADAPKDPNDATPVEQVVTNDMLANLRMWSYDKYENIVNESSFTPEKWTTDIGSGVPPDFESLAGQIPQPNPYGDQFDTEEAALAAGVAYRDAHPDDTVVASNGAILRLEELTVTAPSIPPFGSASTNSEIGLLTFLNLAKLASGSTFTFTVEINGPEIHGGGGQLQSCILDIFISTSLGRTFEADSHNNPTNFSVEIGFFEDEVRHNSDFFQINTKFEVTVNMADLSINVVRTDEE